MPYTNNHTDLLLVLLQYCDAVGWVFWPVKPTTEPENRLQLDSLSTSVNIDHLTITVDNTSAVGNNSCPWVVPQSIKWLSTIARERRIPPDSESGGFHHLFGTSVPHTGSAWRAHHDNNNNLQLVMSESVQYFSTKTANTQEKDTTGDETRSLVKYTR